MPISTRVTNRIRHILDDVLPRRIRDSRWFMAPLFFIWCKGRNVGMWMDFKKIADGMTLTQLRDFYRSADSLAAGRPTDTNPEALAYVLSVLDRKARNLIDVGSGRGYFLQQVAREPAMAGVELFGCDILEQRRRGRLRHIVADNEALPFADRSFDVVTCMHTLEHSRRLDRAIAELRRITRRQLIIVVPRQKYLYYTMDLHLQFFPARADLAAALGVSESEIRQFGDDLVYVSR